MSIITAITDAFAHVTSLVRAIRNKRHTVLTKIHIFTNQLKRRVLAGANILLIFIAADICDKHKEKQKSQSP